jgi:hypothetical protein
MKKCVFFLVIFCLIYTCAFAQAGSKIENVVIITIDGMRWQEVFRGMDTEIASDTRFNQKDSIGIYKKYWAATVDERRRKLFPFLWSVVAANGQLYGNRDLGNKVNTANPYWISYPGYSEIFCGFVDDTIKTNAHAENRNTNLLEFLNKQVGYKGRVAAFCAWGSLDGLLNEKRSGFPIVSGHEPCGGDSPDTEQRLINAMKKDTYNPFTQWEVLDVFTQYAAMDHLKKMAPRILYVGYGDTDEWAHFSKYKDYLDAAYMTDKWISDIWNYIQSNKQYKDKTLLFIAVDHGRGDKEKKQWVDHNSNVAGADEIWFGIMGPGITAKGEVRADMQLYQKQYAQTIAQLLGYTFKCEHAVADGFGEMLGR